MPGVTDANNITSKDRQQRPFWAPRKLCSLRRNVDQPALRFGGRDEAREQRMRLERSRLQLGVVLHPDEPGMVDEFDRLRQQPIRRHARKPHARRLQPLTIGGVDLVAMAMSLGNLRRPVNLRPSFEPGARWPRDKRPAASFRRDRLPRDAARVRCRASIPSSDPTTGWLVGPNSVELASVTPASERAASITAICMPKADAQIGRLALARELRRQNLALRAARAKSSGHQGCRGPAPDAERGLRSRRPQLSIHSSRTRTRLAMPPWVSASLSDL